MYQTIPWHLRCGQPCGQHVRKDFSMKIVGKPVSWILVIHCCFCYRLNVYGPPPSPNPWWNLNSQPNSIWRWGLWGVSRSWGENGALVNGNRVFVRRDIGQSLLSLPLLSATWEHGKKMAHLQARRQSSAEPARAGTLISDFQLPELREIHFCV